MIKPKNLWIYAKKAFFAQLSLVLRKQVIQNCTEIPREQLFLFGLAFSVYEVRRLSVAKLTNQTRDWQATRTTS